MDVGSTLMFMAIFGQVALVTGLMMLSYFIGHAAGRIKGKEVGKNEQNRN